MEALNDRRLYNKRNETNRDEAPKPSGMEKPEEWKME